VGRMVSQSGCFRGAVHDLQIHDLDFINLIFGVPKVVKAVGLKDETGGWNHVVTQLEYASGWASVEAGCMMPQDFPFTAGLRVIFERGVVEYHFRAGGASFEQGQPNSYLLVHEPGIPTSHCHSSRGMDIQQNCHTSFNVFKPTHPYPRYPEDARLAVKTALASRESLECGKPVILRM